MDLFNAFAVDPKRLAGGVWHVFTETTDEVVEEAEIGDRVAVLIASTDNPTYRQNLQKKLRALTIRKGSEIDVKADERITAELVADNIILDFRNWVIQGQPIGFSREKVIELWTDATWVLLKARLLALVGDTNAYKAIQEEAVLKN